MGNGNLGPFENETHPTSSCFFYGVIHMSFLSWNILGWCRILLSIYFVNLQGLLITDIVTISLASLVPGCEIHWDRFLVFRWSDGFEFAMNIGFVECLIIY